MKAKAALILLILIVLGLGIGLIVIDQHAADAKKVAEGRITTYSNSVLELQTALDDQKTVNLTLETNLTTTKVEYSNKLVSAEASLANTSASLTKLQAESKAAAEAAAAEIVQRDKKIASLETQNQDLDKEAFNLRSNITNLESRISATQQKLASSEGERDFLLTQLKQLQGEKADLDKKFNDLAVLRAQITKIKDELALSRRLDWLRRGVYATSGMKGGERMGHHIEKVAATNSGALNVELRQDGTSTVIPGPTNAPVLK